MGCFQESIGESVKSCGGAGKEETPNERGWTKGD
jgi:hypothetical protein